MNDDIAGAVVGAPEPTAQIDYKPMLEGLGSDKIATIFNPLSQDFRVQYARQEALSPTPSYGHQVARDRAGLDLSKEQGVQGHRVHYHILKAGKTENLPADIAQVAVRQLITYIISVRNKGKSSNMVADPQTRKEVEREVIIKVIDSSELLNQAPVSTPEPTEVPNPPPGTGVNYASPKDK